MSMDELQRHVALTHEAAHVLARTAIGLAATGVSVDGSGGGFTEGTSALLPQWELAKVSMAGPAVEQRFLKQSHGDMLASWFEAVKNSDPADEDDVTAAGMWAGSGFAWAQGLLLTHWADVERIAATLAVETTLSASEVSELVSPVEFDHDGIRFAGAPYADLTAEWIELWGQR